MGYLETAEVWHKFPEIKLSRVSPHLWLLFKRRAQESRTGYGVISNYLSFWPQMEEEVTPPLSLSFSTSVATVLPWSISIRFPYWQDLNSG